MNPGDDRTDLADRGLITEHCDRFRDDWLADRRPSVEEYLAEVPESDRPCLLRRLIAIEVELRRIRGEQPTPAEYHERFPNHATLVDATFATDASPRQTEHSERRPPHRSDPDTARNLLLGILALQHNFIDRAALLSAFNTWIEDKNRSLGTVLVEQGRLAESRHAILNALVAEHLELHGGDPDRSLAALNPPDPVRRDLEHLADADLAASLGHVGTCRTPADDPDATVNWAGTPMSDGVGFTVVRLHARGGLGEVFAATDEELHREVALKRIQEPHADNPDSRARFLQEAEITGGLEHPGIVPVYRLGHYENGRPFYAMRLVKGEDLRTAVMKFHDADRDPKRDPGERTVSLRRLLGRFLDVCNAVAYAHSRGVLHRDLKPANILLGKFGETLIIDWGLAKVVGRADPGPADAEPTLRPPSGSGVESTRAGAAIGTPGYMSPEQARGDIDRLGPASDVFGLGATLYYIITGRQPFPGEDFAERLRKNERCEFLVPRVVKPSVPRPLEAICLKAMAPQPEDRYLSPRALAEDIEHWLADEPVSAMHEPRLVRIMRWARCHRTPVATAVASLLVATTLLAGIWGWLRHRQRAAEDLARSLLFEADRLGMEAASGPDLSRWGQAIAAARQAQGILDTGGRDPDLRRRIDATLAVLTTQERDRQMLKDLDEAELARAAPTALGFDNVQAFREAKRRAFRRYGIEVESLPPAQAVSMIRASAIQKDLVAALDAWASQIGNPLLARLCSIASTLDVHPMRVAIRDALVRNDRRELQRLLREVSGQPDISQYPPNWLYAIGFNLMSRQGDPDAAIALLVPAQRAYPNNFHMNSHLARAYTACRPPKYIEAIRFHSIAVALRPDSAIARTWLAQALRSHGDLEAAVRELERTIEIAPEFPLAHLEIAKTHHQLGHTAEAFASLIKARDIADRLARKPPDDGPGHLSGPAGILTEIGALLGELGRDNEAVKTFEKALAIYDQLTRSHPSNAPPDDALVGAYDTLHGLLVRMGRRAEALEASRNALAIRERRTRAHPDNPGYRNDLFWAYHTMGNRLKEAGRTTEALRAFRDAREFIERLARERPGSAEVASFAGVLLHHLAGLDTPGDPTATLGTIRQAIAHQRRAMALDPKNAIYPGHLRNHLVHMAGSASAHRMPADASAAAREWAALVAGNPTDLYEAAGFMSRCVPLAKDKAERDRYADGAIGIYRAAIAAAPPDKDQGFLATVYSAMGRLLDEVGRFTEALDAYKQSLPMLEAIVRLQPGNTKAEDDLVARHDAIGGLLSRMGRHAQALESFNKALAIRERLAQAHPNNLPYQVRQAGSYERIGDFLIATGRGADARDPLHKALAIGDRLAREHPESAEGASVLGLTLHRLAALDLPHDWPAAREKFQQGIAHQKRAASLQPANAGYPIHLRNQWIALSAIALANRDPAEASAAARESAALARSNPMQLYEAANLMSRCVPLARDSAERDRYANGAIGTFRVAIAAASRNTNHAAGDPDPFPLTVRSYNEIGYLYLETGRDGEALNSYRTAREIGERLARDRPGSAKVAGEFGLTLHQIAHLEANSGKATARETMRQAIVQTQRALTMDPGSNMYQSRMISHLIRLNRMAPAQGVPTEAFEAAHLVAARMANNPGSLYNTACILSRCLPLARDAAERDCYSREALEALRAAIKAGWSNAPWTGRDPDFVPLHDRPDFHRLVAELFDRGFPNDPFVP
jgi:serine/threonine protein kinase/tetratricopeptide (TPR) repeat protein